MEIGIYTFVETVSDPVHRMRDLMEEIRLADEVGIDVFGLGEHHRPDYLISSPAVALAAAATITKQIKFTSAVTVLSSDDPIRVYQQFATLDLISNGRAEIMAGRGSFIESFPLFGYDLEQYNELFTSKLDRLLEINRDSRRYGVYPTATRELPVWIAVGGTPESAARAGRLGLPLALAIIGGYPERFAGLVELYRQAGREAGHDTERLKVSINSHTFVAETSQQAADLFYPGYAEVMTRIGRERGWPPTTRAQFDMARAPRGALLVGSAEEVIDKILFEYDIFRHDRFMAQLSVGPVPHREMMKAIELLGTVVAPAVRKGTGEGGNVRTGETD